MFHGNVKFNWAEREEKRKQNRKKCNKKYRKTEQGNLNHRMEVSIRRALKEMKAGRKWEKLVGYSVEELIQRLSVNFQKGMTWDRFLNGEIHIDHKKPISLFNYKTPEDQEFKDCWSLANLQPLWARDNIIKSNKF